MRHGMDNKRLISILRGTSEFTSDDVTRRNLTHVNVPTPTRIEATDGWRLVRIDTDAPHGLPVGYLDPKAALARAKCGAPIEAAAADTFHWPAFDNVLAGTDAPADKPESVGLNPVLLADVAAALADVIGAGKKHAPAITMHTRGALDPVRFDAKANGITAVALLMPMRKQP
jgi:hypothetical protein